MVYISPRGMKLMRVIHIVAAQIWVGAVICIFGFALYCFNNTAVEQFLVLAPMMCVQAGGLGALSGKCTPPKVGVWSRPRSAGCD